jgi:hypothetical protein
MGRFGKFIILIFVLAFNLRSQDTVNFRELDSAMYANTVAGNWEGVIMRGKTALRDGIDYYYLRYRLGLAYFGLRNYRRAAGHFEKALTFNNYSKTANEYLYYSYLYSARHQPARVLSAGWNDFLKQNIAGGDKGFVEDIRVESGMEISNNHERNSPDRPPGNVLYREQDLYGNSWYANLGFALKLHPAILLNAAYTRLSIRKEYQAAYRWNKPDSVVTHSWGIEKYFPVNSRVSTYTYDYSVKQDMLYLNVNTYLGRGWTLTPAIHYIHALSGQVDASWEESLKTDTAAYISAVDSVIWFDYPAVEASFKPSALKLDNFVFSLSVLKQISIFDLGMSASWSNLNNDNQFQLGVSALYYPFGNLVFYGVTKVKFLQEDGEHRGIYAQMLGFKVWSFLWSEAFVGFGNLKSSNEYDARIIYNITDNINLKAGFSLIFVLSPSLNLNFRYQYLQKGGKRFEVLKENFPVNRIVQYEYMNQSISGGLKWKL